MDFEKYESSSGALKSPDPGFKPEMSGYTGKSFQLRDFIPVLLTDNTQYVKQSLAHILFSFIHYNQRFDYVTKIDLNEIISTIYLACNAMQFCTIVFYGVII